VDINFSSLSLFAVFFGFGWAATVPPTVKLTVARFGRERANIVFGWIFAGHQLGAAAAAYGAGLSRTLLATYLPAIFAAAVLCLLAAAFILRIEDVPSTRIEDLDQNPFRTDRARSVLNPLAFQQEAMPWRASNAKLTLLGRKIR
jgi:MFS family permease